jgi:SNF2 family DNA or RNA helicase
MVVVTTMREHPDLIYPDDETLRPWQPDNVRGILKAWRDGSLTGTGTAIGAMLASGMGMGKCAISIIAANTLGLERVLVIAPKAAIPDWHRELRRWHTRHPLIRHLSARKRWIDISTGWMLVNYANVDRWPELKEREWDLLILDESQAVKEPSAKRTNFIFGGKWRDKEIGPIPCRKALVVTGTPLKNRPEELFTQLHFLDPQHWPDRKTFINRYYPRGRQVTDRGRVVQNVKPRNLIRLGNELARTVLVRANKDTAGLPLKHFEQVLIPPFDMPSAPTDQVAGQQAVMWFESMS